MNWTLDLCICYKSTKCHLQKLIVFEPTGQQGSEKLHKNNKRIHAAEIDIDQYMKALLIACDCKRLYLVAFVVPFSFKFQSLTASDAFSAVRA